MFKKIILSWLITITLVFTIIPCGAAEISLFHSYQVATSSGLRLRRVPYGDILTVMPNNSIINIYRWEGKWGYGMYNGVYGCCHSDYIEKVTSIQQKETKKTEEIERSETLEYFGTLRITGYTPAKSENGGYDVTCKGIKLTSVIGTCVAVNKSQIPLGTKLYIEGIGYRVAMDTGVKKGTIDVLCKNRSDCYAITGNRKVYIVR